ncbi:MAG: hypothetical protein HYX88_04440 [Chloroflexi bacterium]|nr:hypothetical protein [Chloroflexota bacterium]
MANLETTLAGVKTRNPFAVAAMCANTGAGKAPRAYADFLLRCVEAGAGAVSTPGTVLERDSPLEKKKAIKRFIKAGIPGYGKKMGVFGVAASFASWHRMDHTLELIHILKRELPPDVPVIGNVIGPGGDAAGWAEASRLMVEAGCDLIELDLSCPGPATYSPESRAMKGTVVPPETEAEKELAELGLWPLLADMPSVLGPVVEAAVKAVSVPVGAKMSPESGYPRNVLIMKVLARAGARFISNLNGVLSMAPPDINNGGKPPYPFFSINPVTAAAGPWLTPLVLRNIGMGLMFVPEVEHVAVGGIVHPEQAVQYLMLGAKHIGLASAIYLAEGTRSIRRFRNFLERYLDEHGYETVDDLIGVARKYFGRVTEDMDWGGGRIVASVDRKKCTDCGICLDGFSIGCMSEDIQVKGRPQVLQEICGACGFCVAICPLDAITLVEREVPLSPTLEW